MSLYPSFFLVHSHWMWIFVCLFICVCAQFIWYLVLQTKRDSKIKSQRIIRTTDCYFVYYCIRIGQIEIRFGFSSCNRCFWILPSFTHTHSLSLFLCWYLLPFRNKQNNNDEGEKNRNSRAARELLCPTAAK